MREPFEARTVGEIVAADWRAAAVFEQFGIDICSCRRQAVVDACQAAGIDAPAVERALEALQPADAVAEESRWPIDRLIDHIVRTHHAYVRSALPRIGSYLATLTEDHGARHPELAQIAAEFDTLSGALLEHLLKEEYVLFPYIRELPGAGRSVPSPFGTVENPIRMMEREHQDVASIMRAIRRLSADYTPPPDECRTYHVCFDELAQFERDLYRHIHLEDNVLFPRAVELEASRR